MKIRTIKKQLLAGMFGAGAALAMTGTSAHAEVLYFETFEGTSEAIVDYGGFTAFRDDGTDFTASTIDPVRVNIANNNYYVFIGSAVANVGDSYAMISGAGSIDPATYQNDLSVSFTSDSTDEGSNDPEMGWRVLATVGSTIYASDFLGIAQGTPTEKIVTVSDAVWHVWTGETSLSDGFNIASIDGGAAITLPAGTISDFGVLAIDGANGNDRMRFRDFTISGTDLSEAPTPDPSSTPRPNVVLIMVDDMGWSDIGCYGSEIQTPNLDSLAADGIRFRQFYNTAKCFPSRAGLLTGVYPQQNGLDNSDANYLGNSVTLAEVLGSAGYHTYASGKHHGLDNLYDRGFDRYYGLRDGASNHFNPGLRRSGEPEPARKGRPRTWADDALVFDTRDAAYQYYFPTNFYTTDFFTSKAQEYLAEWDQQQTGRPFFLYLPYTAPHDPLMAWPEDIAKYEGVYDVGYEAIRTNRYQKQLDLGLITEAQYALSPATHQAWDSLTAAGRTDQARRMQVYAAMIDRVDQKIGELIAQLQAMGVYEDTLILFCADNGSSDENNNKGDLTAEIGGLDRFASLQGHWANVGNTPFKYFKNDSEEGGIRTPLIAHWPNGIVNPGRFSDKRGHLIDFQATLMELAGAEYPRNYDESAVTPLQGTSFTDALYDLSITPRDPLYFQWSSGRAIIDENNYKIVSRDSGSSWKLYDLNTDATELTDLSSTQPALRDELVAKYSGWFTAVKDNTLPSALDDAVAGTFASPIDVNVLANDTDSDGSIDASSLVITRPPIYGTATINPDHTVHYVPGTATVQYDRFGYQVRDDDGEWSNEGFATIDFSGIHLSEAPGITVKMEAEDATLFGGVVQNNRPGASGGEFVNFNPNDPPDYIEWEFASGSAGTGSLIFGYANASTTGPRTLDVSVNGAVVSANLLFPLTGGWDSWSELIVPDVDFLAGTNLIRVTTDVNKDGPNMDYLTVDIPPSGGGAPTDPTDTDEDGMTDLFEAQVAWLNENNPDDAAEDYDGDGCSNLVEFKANTDLNDTNSTINVVLVPEGREFNLNWNASFGQTYYISESTNLSLWTPLMEVTPQSVDGNAWVQPLTTSRFYRVEL